MTAFHRANIFDVLGRADRGTWTHYTLCDAVDWMPPQAQKALFHEIVRTSAPGARVLYRSVEDGSLVERVGMSRLLRLGGRRPPAIAPASTGGSFYTTSSTERGPMHETVRDEHRRFRIGPAGYYLIAELDGPPRR